MYLAFRGLRSTHANKVIHSDAELKNFIVSVYLNMYVWADFAYGTIYENNEGL